MSDEDGWVVTEVGEPSGPYGWLPEAVAALPALEHLVVFGPAVLSLPPIASPTLRRLSLAVADVDHEPDEEPAGWRAQIEARVQACTLPALEATEIAWVVEPSVS